MSPGDGSPAEMRRLLNRLRDDSLVLDDDSADRLLAGRMDPADAPPGYAEAAAVMAAATAPARPDELDGVESVLDAFRAAQRARPVSPRRPHMLVRLLTVKAVAAAFTGALLIGGVAAAATGSLPDPAQRVAHMVGAPAAQTDGKDAGDTTSSTGTDSKGSGADHAKSGSQGTPTGPDLTKIDKTGLCTAYLAGNGGTNGGKYDAVAFEALERAAGGADKVAEFCKDVTASHGESGQVQPDQQSAGSSNVGDHAQGQGQDQQPGDAGGASDAGHGGGQP